jgi:large subunit ribosomal protein LX
MSDVKIFRVVGEIRKPGWQAPFRKELRALKPEDAVEKVYKDLGSQHNAKRYQIKIASVEEIKLEEAENPIIRELSKAE